MLRAIRFILVFAVVAVSAFVARDYFSARESRAESNFVPPDAIEPELNSRSRGWTLRQQTATSQTVEINAQDVKQDSKNSRIELTGVVLRIFHSDESTFDHVATAAAVFNLESSTFVSDEEVTVTLGLSADNPDPDDPSLTRIVTSNVRFDTEKAIATTDSPALYLFDGGEGRSVGAIYDSSNRTFEMKRDAEVVRFPSTPDGVTTFIRGGRLLYHEVEQRIDISGGAELERGSHRMSASDAVVHLKDGRLKRISALQASGVDSQPGRTVRFETPELDAFYSDDGQLEKVGGVGLSKLISESPASVMEAVGNQVDLHYVPPHGGGDSLLERAFLRHGSRIEVTPAGGAEGQEIRRVAAEWIGLKMRSGGRDVESLETLARGSLEMLDPDGQTLKRRLEADRIQLLYGAKSRMEKLHATGSAELIRNSPDGPPLLSWSDSLEADFDGPSGELTKLRQWGGFRFEQGPRKGSADTGLFFASTNRLELEGQSEMDDGGALVRAHKITLDQEPEILTAEGSVTSVYSEAEPGDDTAAVFDSSEPVYASAMEMASNQETGEIRYSGGARMWQQSNRIEGEEIRIDRVKRTLAASVNVASLLTADDQATDIRAESLFYEDDSDRARYEGSVRLKRDGLRVWAESLDAWFEQDEEGGNRLKSALARGEVEVAESNSKTGRRGYGQTADYRPDEDIVILKGSPAKAVNAQGEQTRGAELTYQIDGDSLHVSGGAQDRAYTYRKEGLK